MSHTEHNGAARTHMLNGGGEMGARIRAFDWSQTPLGPIEHWPHSLCTALSICLNATMPLSIIWGQQLIQFYNDAYIPLAIGRHPSILGGAVPENWPDTWPTIKGWLDDVFAGQPAYIENVLLITRRDALDEECYFTMSFSPIHDERGAVGGVFHAMFETTSTILSERRLHTLRSLVVALTDTTSISEISEQTIRVLRDNPHDVPFALVYEIDDTAVRLCALTGAVPDAACIPEWLDLKSQAASAWPFLSAIHQPTPTLMRDLVAPTSESASGRAYNAIKSALALPITLPRAARPVALLVLGLHPQRVFDDSYRRFFEQIAEYLHAAVARVRAAEDERTRTHARAEIERVKATFVSAKSYVSPASLTLLFNPVDVTAQDTHIRELLLRDLDAERVRLEAILQHVPAAIMILRPNGTLIFGNDQVENVFNTAFPTSMSLTDYEWNMYDPVTGALLQPEQSPLARTIVQGETIIGEVVKILNNDGSERYLAVNTAPVRDAAGTLVYGVAAFMDITAHRRADDEARNVRRLLHISLEASNAGVWDMDMIHDRVTGDHMIARIFSLPVEDVIAGRVAPEVYLHAIHPDDRSLLIDAIANAIVRHESYEVDYRVPQANDGVIWVSVRGKPELDDTGRVVRLPGLMFDITARKRAEEALRLSEQRFRYMADHAPVMVWVTDVHASCTYLGKSWCEFTGQSLTAAQGFGWLDVVHADDRVHIQDIFMRANARHEPFQYEYRIRHRNGDYRWAIDTAMPYFSEDGAFLGHIGSVIDITERRHAEARDRFLFQLLDITRSLAEPQHIIAASAEMLGKHLEVDRCAYTEIDTDKQLLTILHDYTTPGMMSIVGTFTMATLGAEGLRLMREGQPYIVADVGHEASIVQHRAVYESIRIGAFIAVPLLKQECLVAGMTVHQRVPRHWKADEIEIVQLVTNLCWESIERARVTRNLRESEERLQALYAQEQAARQQAEEASRLKDEFLATVSHELRTPLTAILGYGQVLQYRQRDDVHTTHIVDKIVQSAMAQSQLIEDLLDVSQIVTGNLRLTPLIINLLPVIQTAI